HSRPQGRLSPAIGLEGGVLSSPMNLRSCAPTRWLSAGAITSFAAMSLAIGSVSAVAAPQAIGSSRAPSAERLPLRPAPKAVLQNGLSPQIAPRVAPACNDQ